MAVENVTCHFGRLRKKHVKTAFLNENRRAFCGSHTFESYTSQVEYKGTPPVHLRGSAYFTIFGTCKTRTMPFQIKIKLFVGAVRRDICRDDLFIAGVACGRHVPCYLYFTRSNVSGPLFILTQQSKSNKPPAQRWWRCSIIGPGRSRSTCTHPRSRRRTAPGQWPSPGWACCRW